MARENIWKYFSMGDEGLSFWTYSVPWASFLYVYIMFSEGFRINAPEENYPQP